MRIVFMGTPWMAVPMLGAIHRAGHPIQAVVSQPDRPAGRHQICQPTPVKALATELGLQVAQPEKIRTAEFRSWIEALAPDLIVVVAYGRILPGWLLAIPSRGCVNVHFSLLPKYRGAAPVNWALVRGELETGVTTMLMDEGMDTGPILLQRSTPIDPDETTPDLARRLVEMGEPLLLETLELLEAGRVVPQVQDHTLATMAPLLKREDGLIDWRWVPGQIRDRVRGFQPWPGAWTTWKGNRLLIWRARLMPEGTSEGLGPKSGQPGEVWVPDRKRLLVHCGAGGPLSIEELQLEGKKKLPVAEFLNGNKLENGERFGAE